MATEPLSQKDIEDRLAELPGWSLDGDAITRTYRLASHFAAAALVVHIAQAQEDLNHHSNLVLGYNTVTLTVNTHDAGGVVTAKDFGLAEKVEALAVAHGVS
ncbi:MULTISPECIES: 4a-hydroxytetrahydrobiopterin dehydratase [unclassified Streptomyces]|uniref:4a-hydroxytetrahydrobiopterin dehydratase n=1 Tax=unclassified Streptomyces TaxID=2593676 RepID=UPI00278C50AD|nr:MULTISPECIES: 4a-hydroxytetrahydrobiopterin dehydratase [unclassified Streptomyces]